MALKLSSKSNEIQSWVERGVSQSMLTTFMQCRKKAALKLEGWRTIRPSAALLFGNMAHEVIGKAFETLDAPPSHEWLKRELRAAIRSCEEESGNRMSSEATQYMEDNAEILMIQLPLYFARYRKDFEKVSWIRIEKKFVVKVPGLAFPIMGYYDRVRRVKGKAWLYETKTKGKVDEDMLSETLHFDFQNGLYLQALVGELKEIPRGVVYDIMRKPGLKLKKGNPRKGEKPEKRDDFLKRIEKDIKSQPEHYFIRFEVAIDKAEIAEFRGELLAVGAEFHAWREGKLKTYKNTTACKQPWGTCEFLAVCARDDYNGFVQRKPGRNKK